MNARFMIIILAAEFLVCEVSSSISLGSCNLSCDGNEKNANDMIGANSADRIVGPPGKSGSEGPRGPVGPTGERGETGVCDCDSYQEVVDEMRNLKAQNEELRRNTFIKDCKEAKKVISTSGINVIYPFEPTTGGMHVYCNQDTDGGGWIVIQRRVSGQVDFFRGWEDYVNGFGNKEEDFWLGLEKIHLLTMNGSHDLRIDLEDKAGNKVYAKYRSFKIGGANENYKLYFGAYTGNAGDSLLEHKEMPFTTKDRDNDKSSGNCAEAYKGAWWYTACHHSNLNGFYGGSAAKGDGVSWVRWKNTNESLKTVEMKIRKI